MKFGHLMGGRRTPFPGYAVMRSWVNSSYVYVSVWSTARLACIIADNICNNVCTRHGRTSSTAVRLGPNCCLKPSCFAAPARLVRTTAGSVGGKTTRIFTGLVSLWMAVTNALLQMTNGDRHRWRRSSAQTERRVGCDNRSYGTESRLYCK